MAVWIVFFTDANVRPTHKGVRVDRAHTIRSPTVALSRLPEMCAFAQGKTRLPQYLGCWHAWWGAGMESLYDRTVAWPFAIKQTWKYWKRSCHCARQVYCFHIDHHCNCRCAIKSSNAIQVDRESGIEAGKAGQTTPWAEPRSSRPHLRCIIAWPCHFVHIS